MRIHIPMMKRDAAEYLNILRQIHLRFPYAQAGYRGKRGQKLHALKIGDSAAIRPQILQR